MNSKKKLTTPSSSAAVPYICGNNEHIDASKSQFEEFVAAVESSKG